MANELIRNFEPILYFHKDETFFPSDAKRYMEHCALWQAEKPFDNQTSWGGKTNQFPRAPMIPLGKIAAAKNEVRPPQQGQPGDTYLGEQQGLAFPFFSADDEERFLDLAGWEGIGGVPSHDVSQASKNAHAHLGILAQLYNHPNASNPALKASRHWYHAEEFNANRLRQMVADQKFTDADLKTFLSPGFKFREPHIICYYFFFPGHIEGLQGCENTETGPQFGSFAGEWACMAILLDRTATNQPFKPQFIGLASRNAAKAQELDDESRVGMIVHRWDDPKLKVFPNASTHLRLFVAKGTHSLYLAPGQKPLEPQKANDPSIANCGAAEKLADKVTEGKGGKGLVYIAKIMGGLVALSGLGVVGGFVWSILEDEPTLGTFGTFIPAPKPNPTQQDFPPEEGDFGMIIHPPTFIPPDAGPDNHVSWPASETAAINNRTYSIIVDRTNADETKRQVWFPGYDNFRGYSGRWGLRVAGDPFTRRAGMRFPPFVEMFLVALPKFLSK
jgi:hypothetical protein